MNELAKSLEQIGVKLFNVEFNAEALIFECDVYAKPGSKVEKVIVAPEGHFIIQTKSRPIEGEANKSIQEMMAKFLGISKSNVEMVRGDKSKKKRIKILVNITANKSKEYYKEKFTSILKD